MNKRLIFTGAAVAVAAGFAFFLPRSGAAVQPQTTSDAYAVARWDTISQPPHARRAPSEVVVYVAGEVARSGVYRLPATARVADALHAAGGATPAGDLVAVNLAEPLADGQEVVVPARGAAPEETRDEPAAGDRSTVRHATARGKHHAHRKRHKRSRKRSSSSMPQATISDISQSAPLDLNVADASQLEDLPGIGPSLADRIVAYRNINGPFASVDDLLDVNGVTDTRLQDIAPYLVVK